MDKIRVSIVSGAYNSASYIQDAYRSLRHQTMPLWEWIVVDDASTDDTLQHLRAMADSDSRVRVLHNKENCGAARSRNRALAEARGEYIAFLDSDDRWQPNKLMDQLAFMDSVNASASFTAYRVVSHEGAPTGKVIDSVARQKITYQQALRKRATIGCSTVIVAADAIGSAVMPDIRTGQDYAFWLRLLRSGVIFHHLPEPLSDYRITPGSISRNKTRKALRQWQIYRELERLGVLDAALNFCFYAVRAVIR